MKKYLIFLTITALFIFGTLFLSSCSPASDPPEPPEETEDPEVPVEPEQLSSPQNLTKDKRVMKWDPVENAAGYSILVNEIHYTVTEARFELYSLPGGTYTFEVSASGDGKRYTESEPVRLEIELTEPEQTVKNEDFVYMLLEDRSGYFVTLGTNKYKASYVIPAYCGDYPVTVLGAMYVESLGLSKQYNTTTKYVKLPDTLKTISRKAFADMGALFAIEIPDSVTEIGSMAFVGCTSLTNVTLPKGLKEIPSCCFQDTALSRIEIPDSVETIRHQAFANFTDGKVKSVLSKIVLPASVKSIGDMAFYGRENLKTVTFSSVPDHVGTKILDNTAWYSAQGSGAMYIDNILIGFKGKISGGTFAIPAGTTVAKQAFAEHNELKKVIFGKNVKLAGTDIFEMCESLTEVILADDVTELPESTFSCCKSLREITLPASLRTIGESAFYGCEALQTVNFGEGLETIVKYAFTRCSSLASLTLPRSLKAIGVSAFTFCPSLESVLIPGTLEELGLNPFENCTSSLNIFFEGTQERWQSLYAAHNVGPHYTEEKNISGATVCFYSEEKPETDGNYWHYVDGKPTKW